MGTQTCRISVCRKCKGWLYQHWVIHTFFWSKRTLSQDDFTDPHVVPEICTLALGDRRWRQSQTLSMVSQIQWPACVTMRPLRAGERVPWLSCGSAGIQNQVPSPADVSGEQMPHTLFFSTFFIYFWDRERQSMNGGGAEREGDTESETGSRLRAISPEPDAYPTLLMSPCHWAAQTWQSSGTMTMEDNARGDQSDSSISSHISYRSSSSLDLPSYLSSNLWMTYMFQNT